MRGRPRRRAAVARTQLQALQAALDGDGFAPAERTLIHFSRQANRDPLRLPEADMTEVRAAGWSGFVLNTRL
ncbi:hypothetical protein CKO42_21540 [Lamprobacter modestohalophilus]|uniref:Uncharacterized protein n=1 Tax=Lamprobacter modestohalophilus TaxID=1064514 RepID=A0A9X0WCI9_9GAMM|nr:hypothetical protein [Lamprobacter modestohalophilus]MBK1620959.1 hypothetical protein [Lamprobacter modestohalophilus]